MRDNENPVTHYPKRKVKREHLRIYDLASCPLD